MSGGLEESVIESSSIEEIAERAVPKVSVLGIGGAGCNIVSWMKRRGVLGARICALNSDAQHLSITNADERLLIGYNITGGLGCGGFPEKGARAAEESSKEIKALIDGSRLVFITAGLGGGTGTGASPIVARIAKDMGALTVGVVTIPFRVERTRLLKAKEGLKRLVDECDAVIVIDNNRLMDVACSMPLTEAFAVANELIATFIKNITEIISVPSLVNMDLADLRSIMAGSGVCAIGFGEGQGETKVENAVEKSLETPLLDIGDTGRTEGAIVYIEGGDDMTLEDVNRAAEIVIERIAPHAKVSWGARVNSALQGRMKVTVVLAGVESPFLVEGRKPSASIETKHDEGAEEIEVVEQPAGREKRKGAS